MISKENLEKIYMAVVEDKELTTSLMREFGFNYRDLNKLIQDKVIRREKRGLYELRNIERLYSFGKKQKDAQIAELCFKKCLELNPDHLKAYFQLFLLKIQAEDYQEALELSKILLQSEDKDYNIEYNFYLYLLNIIADIPQNYRDYARSLNLEDIKISSSSKIYARKETQNNIRALVLQGNLKGALKAINMDLEYKSNKSNVQYAIVRALLQKAVRASSERNSKIVDLIRGKNYEEAIEKLQELQNRNFLNKPERYMLKLLKKYVQISEEHVLPERHNRKPKNIFAAIDMECYDVALKMNHEYNRNKNILDEYSVFYLILSEICDLINKLSDKTKKVETDASTSLEEKDISLDKATNIELISSFLSEKDFENAVLYIKKYLKLISKEKYYYLPISSIKLNILRGDNNFGKTISMLRSIGSSKFTPYISNYIKEFHTKLFQGKYEECKIYLDIIYRLQKNSKYHTGVSSVINDPYKLLELLQKNDKKENSTALASFEELLEKIERQEAEDLKALKEMQESQILQEPQNSLEDFMDQKYDELWDNGGIILLEPMDDKRVKSILELSKDYRNMIAFVININKEKRVVLQFNYIQIKQNSYANIFSQANQAYKNGQYDDCIEKYLKLLHSSSNKEAHIYAKIGKAYCKKKDYKLAIDYLTVATAITETETYDFSDFIEKLERLLVEESESQKEIECHDEINKYLKMNGFEEINSKIIDSDTDVTTACQQMNLSQEEIDIIYLIYAREFYLQGDQKIGDMFLMAVESSENKTEKVSSLLNYIKGNRNLFLSMQGKSSLALPTKILRLNKNQ